MGVKSTRRKGSVIGLLDVGTSKTVCIIAGPGPSLFGGGAAINGLTVLGAGQERSRGLKAGVVVDLDAVEATIRSAVVAAERQAGVTLEEVTLGVACGRLKSSTFAAETRVDGRVVANADVGRLMAAGRSYVERDGRLLLHMNCIGYRLDGASGIIEPRGMAGTMLGADLHAVTADEPPLQNLVHAVERAYLEVAGVVPAPYASALAATTAEERGDGVIAVDLGAGTTTIAMFAEGHLLSTDVIPVGGHHVTIDLARTFSTSLAEAERIKTLYGKVGKAGSDDSEVISYTVENDGEPVLWQTARGRVREIVGARIVGLLEQVAERIERTSVAVHAGRRMVFTGGGSLIPGLGEMAADTFQRPARVAHLRDLAAVPAPLRGPEFATAIGLVYAAADPAAGVRWNDAGLESTGYLGRVGQWLRQSF